MKKRTKGDLKPYSAIIQTCPDCGKVDVYLNDGHTCDKEIQAEKQNKIYYKD